MRIDLVAVPQLVLLHTLSMPRFMVVTRQDKLVMPKV